MRIKICGITTEEDALLAARLGADAIGLNFYPQSRRFLTEDRASAILRLLPPFVDPVALFVNEPVAGALDLVRRLGRIRTLQWHGNQPEPSSLFEFHVIPAFPVRDRDSLTEVKRYLDRYQAAERLPSAILLDGYVPGEHGGTGQMAPWSLLADFRVEVPIILAGGLTPENVVEAIRIVRPWAVDVASGVESQPGRKDPDKLRRFIENARAAV